MNLSEHFKLDPNSPSYVAWARDGRGNTSGIKGLSWHHPSGAWRGQIARNGKRYTKRSKDKAEVIEWLITTRNELHKEYANHG